MHFPHEKQRYEPTSRIAGIHVNIKKDSKAFTNANNAVTGSFQYVLDTLKNLMAAVTVDMITIVESILNVIDTDCAVLNRIRITQLSLK